MGLLDERLGNIAVNKDMDDNRSTDDTSRKKDKKRGKQAKDKQDIGGKRHEGTYLGKYHASEEFSEMQKKPKANEEEMSDDPYGDELTEEELAFMDEFYESLDDKQDIAREKRRKRLTIAGTVFWTTACVYMIAMIYGVLITKYEYNADGEVVPIVMSVSDLEASNEYNKVLWVYVQAREIYEDVLALDYRLANGIEDVMSVAPEYQVELDEKISPLINQMGGIVVSAEYSQVNNMIGTWLSETMAIYCSAVATAITMNDAAYEETAITYRSYVESDFRLITENMVVQGEKIKGVDIGDLSRWSPDDVAEALTTGNS